MAKPKDGSDPPKSLMFRKAQYLVQLLVGIDMGAEEYTETVDLVREQLEEVYWMGYQKSASKDVFRKETVRPPTPPGSWEVEIDLNKEDE